MNDAEFQKMAIRFEDEVDLGECFRVGINHKGDRIRIFEYIELRLIRQALQKLADKK